MFWRTLPISSAYACSQPFDFLGPPTLQILTVVRYSVVFCFRHTSPSDLIDFQTLFPALLQSASCWTPQERRLRGAGYFVGSSENHELTPQSLVQTSWQRPHHCMIGCDTVVLYLFYIILYLVCHSTLLHLLRYPNVSDVSVVRIKLHTTPLDERQSTQRGKANRKGCHKRKSWHILYFGSTEKQCRLSNIINEYILYIYILIIIYIYYMNAWGQSFFGNLVLQGLFPYQL